ncbi:hypothetical protein B0H21DRAFT_197785 [Amylocystis lapponica]|nr:hypothetical protein B0H21DRAFT_197785 [Amylocystis lapponica]
MAVKRKFEYELEAVDVPMNAKQPKLVPFPNSDELDSDVAMSDGSISDVEPLFLSMQSYHSRLPSNASYSSSAASDSPHNSPMYPVFDLYPHDSQGYFDAGPQLTYDASFEDRRVGLLQPNSPSFTHHGQNCSQVPKLRIACSPGLNGQRTMWAHCEQCGAIDMVQTD